MGVNPIAILPDHVADQIAAGEVVERPASVVKELVENSLDAGARRVVVEVEGGGKGMIRVVDDGFGMTRDEVALALTRHATSKLRTIDDLYRLGTMGFRGEALPSIASVSRMTITTRSRDGGSDIGGTRLEIEAGRVVSSSEVGAPVGTQIEVRDLLHNVPARLKFLKGDATEASHITDAVQKLAIANPGVHFRLKNKSRTTIAAPEHTSEIERARALLGSRLGRKIHEARGEELGIKVRAYLAGPDLAQTTSRGLQLFAGRRPVRDRGLLHAVVTGYGELIPRGRYPVAIIFVDVPNPDIDVNVHPQKLEVRFADPQAVYSVVRHTVSRAVAEAPWLSEQAPEVSPVRMEIIASSSPPGRASERAASYAAARTRDLFSWGKARPRPGKSTAFPVGRALGDPELGAPPVVADGAEGEGVTDPDVGIESPLANGTVPGIPVGELDGGAAPRADADADRNFFAELRYIGQLDRTFLVCEAAGELVLIDQHAAHERVEYQRLRERHQQCAPSVQRLLFPTRVELEPALAEALPDCVAALEAVGFELEPFGQASYAIKAVPSALRGDATPVLVELLEQLAEQGGSRAVDERIDAVFATIACHSVVRAGDVLSRTEVEALLASMDGVDYRAHCPHGRPVLLRISVAEIARRLGR